MNARTSSTVAIFAAAIFALSGCASTASTTSTTGANDSSNETNSTAPSASAKTAAESIMIMEAWIKAASEGMSGAFGELHNAGDTDITITSVSSDVAHGVEMHETIMDDAGVMMMQQKDGGFVIPAGAKLALEPGGNHFMLMGLMKPVQAGEEITFTLTFSDGSTLDFIAPAKDYSGANETYGGEDMHTDSGH